MAGDDEREKDSRMTIDVKFIDGGRKATEKPDPRFPEGKMVNLAPHALAKTCSFNLPYPAPRCGFYSVSCRTCTFAGLVTVAGRPDDPNVVTIPCKPRGLN